MTDSERPILLDTHYWIWQQAGQIESIPPGLRRSFERAASKATLLLSTISVWELALLDARGRIRLHSPCERWVEDALSGLTLVPLTPEIAIHSTRLPGDLHRDPCDRIIAATPA